MNQSAAADAKIMVVDDEPEILHALERTLRPRWGVEATTSPAQALEKLASPENKGAIAVVISDQRMPEMTGIEFLSRVARTNPLATRVLLTAFTETTEVLESINRAEIYRFITKPWENVDLQTTVHQCVQHHALLKHNAQLIRELGERNERLTRTEQELRQLNARLEKAVEERTAQLKIANERLSEQALTDPLTRIANRRALFQKFPEELERSTRYRHPLAVVMADVDHFKEFNDMEGHVCGDEALRKIAAVLLSNLRKTDLLCRYGGEEFCILMPETRFSQAIEICGRLRTAVETTEFQGGQSVAYLTLSLGVAQYPGSGETAEALVHNADQALYEAKQGGRNRVVAYRG